MNRVFIREKFEEENFHVNEKQKIGIFGMSGSAGTSFIATSLAKVLSYNEDRRVTFVEICGEEFARKPLIYDALGMDKRFSDRDFTRFYESIREGRNIKGKVNLDERINWALIAPDDLKNETMLTPLERVRLINNISGDIIICDIGAAKDQSEILSEMDVLVFVIDPMPSKLIAGYANLQEAKRFEYLGKTVVWVINKYNAGINKRELLAFLKTKGSLKLPYLNPEKMYAAEYNCKIPYEIKEIREETRDMIEKIVNQHVINT